MTPVSELLALKIENVRLKLVNIQNIGNTLVAEQNALVEQARVEVGAPVGHAYNTDTHIFQDPNGPQPLSASVSRRLRRKTE